jgi:hypothetical protein
MMPALSSDRSKLPWGRALIPVVAVGLAGWFQPLPHPVAAPEESGAKSAPDSTKGVDDIRIHAFLEAYSSLIDSVYYPEGDVVFMMAGRPIHFQDGRMLAEDRLEAAERYDPIFYPYPLEPLVDPPPRTDPPTYSTDHLEALFGTTEAQIRRHCRSISFLGHGMFLNTLVLEPLREVEREIRAAADIDPEVAEWIEELDVTYSFIFRDIADSRTRSLHGFGLAVDLVPSSYGGRQVYWRWSRVLDREDWYRIPLTRRWSPPQAVITAFERNGFVWGGKWSHFDTIHFEYRPEIILTNRIRSPSA